MGNEKPADDWDPAPDLETPSMTYDYLALGAEPSSFSMLAEDRETRER